MQPEYMPLLAELLSRILVKGEAPEQVRPEVIALRHQFHALHFVLE
jgi:glycine hydroxymethyltransferase